MTKPLPITSVQQVDDAPAVCVVVAALALDVELFPLVDPVVSITAGVVIAPLFEARLFVTKVGC